MFISNVNYIEFFFWRRIEPYETSWLIRPTNRREQLIEPFPNETNIATMFQSNFTWISLRILVRWIGSQECNCRYRFENEIPRQKRGSKLLFVLIGLINSEQMHQNMRTDLIQSRSRLCVLFSNERERMIIVCSSEKRCRAKGKRGEILFLSIKKSTGLHRSLDNDAECERKRERWNEKAQGSFAQFKVD